MRTEGRRIGVALFGLGRAGNIHAPNLSNNRRVDFRWIVENDVEKAEKFVLRENYLATRVVCSKYVEEVLKDDGVHACMICTPTFTHEDYVLRSLRAGKAVFCEKPIANTLAALVGCYDEAEKCGKPLFCAFNRRFDQGILDICESTRNGAVGDIHIIKTTSRDSPLSPIDYLKISEGIFHDCAVHDIDMVCWIVGEIPISVYAQATAFLPSIAEFSDVDTVAIVLKFPSGVIAQIDLSRFAAYGYDQRLEVFGNKGMLVNENNRPTAVQFSNAQGTHQPPIYDSFPTRYAQSYKNELDHFLDVIMGKAELRIRKEDIILSFRIVEACENSLKTGNAVVISN